jgi:hypothetical protein
MYHDARFRKRKVCTIFLHLFIFKFTISNVWTERIFQASAQTIFDIRLDEISLYFSIHVSFNNLTFTRIYFCAVIQTLNNLNEHEFFWFGKKCVSAPDNLQNALNNFIVTYRLQMKEKNEFFVHTVFHQFTVLYVAWKKMQCQEGSISDVRGNIIRQCPNTFVNDWTLHWQLILVLFRFKSFLQPMDRVYFILTENILKW